MKHKPLIQTNKYLKNKALRDAMLVDHAIASSKAKGFGARASHY